MIAGYITAVKKKNYHQFRVHNECCNRLNGEKSFFRLPAFVFHGIGCCVALLCCWNFRSHRVTRRELCELSASSLLTK